MHAGSVASKHIESNQVYNYSELHLYIMVGVVVSMRGWAEDILDIVRHLFLPQYANSSSDSFVGSNLQTIYYYKQRWITSIPMSMIIIC